MQAIQASRHKRKIIPAKHPNSSIRDLWNAMAGSGSGSEGNQSVTGHGQPVTGTGIQSRAQGTGFEP